MIGQAVINVKSGGRKRLSTLTAGLALLFLIVALKSLMIQIPTAALIGIMITVAFETFDWESTKKLKKSIFNRNINHVSYRCDSCLHS